MKYTQELTLDRIREIIQSNPDSPLFARFADLLFQKGLINEALFVIENGLRKHKLYSTAYIVYAKILLQKGRDEEAVQSLRKALHLSPSCQSAKFMIDKITHKDFRKRMKGEEKDTSTEPYIRKRKPVTKNEIENIIEKLENANSLIIKADPNFDKQYQPPEETPEIITETMYHILINQGLFEKAYNVLQKLIIKNPIRKDYYEQQLNWLRSKLDMRKE
ncbi:MAG: tetratricopeptide repeat protein [Ignavibacteria bacterium]